MATIAAHCRLKRLFLVASLMTDNPKGPRPMPTLPLPSDTPCPIQFIVVPFVLTVQSLAQTQRRVQLGSMTRLCKQVAVGTAMFFSVSLVASAASSGISESKSSTSSIVDFSPTSFVAKATANFLLH
jgi:hypothetical protein